MVVPVLLTQRISILDSWQLKWRLKNIILLHHFGGFEHNSLLHLLNEEQSNLEQGMLDVLQLSPHTDELSLTSVITLNVMTDDLVQPLICHYIKCSDRWPSPATLDSSAAVFTNNIISDHQLYNILSVPNLSNTTKVPKYTNILRDANSTTTVKADISKAVFPKLNPDISANLNEKYDILEIIIVHNINKHFPRRQVKFNKYKHKTNTWITKGILH